MPLMSTSPRDPLWRAALRGLRGFCPRCGVGRIFFRYLKVSPACPDCGLELGRYPADDGPAYFTILLVGHLVVAPLLLFPFIWKTPAMVIVPAVLIPLATLTLLVLPRVKGAVIGLLYAQEAGRGRVASPAAARRAPP